MRKSRTSTRRKIRRLKSPRRIGIMPTAAPVRFEGFPKGGFDFFLELQARQSREWFKDHKQRYEELWVRPLDALLVELAERVSDVFPTMTHAGRHIFRIQRDTRFSADKSPYKTHIAAHQPIRPVTGERWFTPSLYIHFGLDDSILAIGTWEVGKELLPLLRERFADDKTGGKLQRIMDGLAKEGFSLSAHEELKRVPAPYPADHPRAELLKRKGLSVSVPDIPEELMTGRELLDWMSDRVHMAAPVALWLDEALKPGKG